MTDIRLERPQDYRAAEALTREAFWNYYGPGAVEHYLLHTMRAHPDFIPALTWVAEVDGVLAGHIAYTRCSLALEDGGTYTVLCFGPLSVHPDFQGSGVGSALVRHTLELARTQGYGAVCITGDPNFYGRKTLGFRCAERYDIRCASGAFMPALLARELIPGALTGKAGRFVESSAYAPDMSGFDAFDAAFPHRESVEGGSTQARFQVLSSLQYGI